MSVPELSAAQKHGNVLLAVKDGEDERLYILRPDSAKALLGQLLQACAEAEIVLGCLASYRGVKQ